MIDSASLCVHVLLRTTFGGFGRPFVRAWCPCPPLSSQTFAFLFLFLFVNAT